MKLIDILKELEKPSKIYADKDPNKPISYILLGPSGAGKTHLTKELTIGLYNEGDFIG